MLYFYVLNLGHELGWMQRFITIKSFNSFLQRLSHVCNIFHINLHSFLLFFYSNLLINLNMCFWNFTLTHSFIKLASLLIMIMFYFPFRLLFFGNISVKYYRKEVITPTYHLLSSSSPKLCEQKLCRFISEKAI